MDFISNLIKRPISLVLNETPTTMDKFPPISSSLPNTPSVSVVLDANQEESPPARDLEKQLLNNNNNNNNSSNIAIDNRPLSSMSSSYNGGSSNITDFIGVPEEFLAEFEDILPPPPPPSALLTHSQSLLNMQSDTRSLSMTPPPPPPLTPSMKASQTIDELLLQMNDNLQEAGLNDDVLLAIELPSNNAELSPISSKAALNNSKLNSSTNSTQKTPTTTSVAAGTAAPTVFEANSSLHKFHIDPELETGLFNDQQHTDTGVNRSSNKFVGLTEFDEAKIPALPGDLNPNIEEQYGITFEKCFIQSKRSTTVPEEFNADQTHLLLPPETDTAASSDNETFADCNQDDDRDPLATTYAETSTLDTTTDLEAYQSAGNNTINANLYHTMDNIADITMETESEPLQQAYQTQVLEELKLVAMQQQQFEAMDEDEPMDIDMNATMEMLQHSSNNIQQVEKVIQHAENILQHIEEKKPFEELVEQDPLEVREEQKQCETSKMTFVVNTPMENNSEMEESKHELSLNKSIELPMKPKVKTVSSECIIQEIIKESDVTEEEGDLENKSTKEDKHNLTNDAMNLSTNSNTSSKSAAGKPEMKLNLTSGMMNTSITSQKSSAPNSPSFPIKQKANEGFPRSPKSVENPHQSPFLEKSDYFENQQQVELFKEQRTTDLNGTYVEQDIATASSNQFPTGFNKEMVQNEVSPTQFPQVASNRTSVASNNEEPIVADNLNRTSVVLNNEEPIVADNLNRTSVVANNEEPIVADNLNRTSVFSNNEEPIVADNLNRTSVIAYNEEPIVADNLNRTSVISNNEEPVVANNLNGTFEEVASTEVLSTNNMNGTFVEPAPLFDKDPPISPEEIPFNSPEWQIPAKQDQSINVKVVPPQQKESTNEHHIEPSTATSATLERFPSLDKSENSRRTFCVNGIENSTQELLSTSNDESRRTFSVASEETLPKKDSSKELENPSSSALVEEFPSLDKPDNSRRTFHINNNNQEESAAEESFSKTKNDSRRTFNVASDDTVLNTSMEPMDVDDGELQQNVTMPIEPQIEQKSQSPTLSAMHQTPALQVMEQISQSPPLPTMQQSPALPTEEQRSQSPPLPTMQQSPALPTEEQRSQSPPLPAMQQKSQSPSLNEMPEEYQSPPLPNMQQRSQSPPLPTIQQKSQSPPLPAMQSKSQSPPLPAMQQKSQIPPLQNMPEESLKPFPKPIQIKEEPISPLPETLSSTTFIAQPPSGIFNIQKRPSIHDHAARARGDILSAKEQSNIKVKDEKDIFVEKFTPSPVEDIFTAVSATSTTLTNSSGFPEFDQTSSSLANTSDQQKLQQQQQFDDDEFHTDNQNLTFNLPDFDYLLTKGNNSDIPVNRSSLLLKFDPLFCVQVPINQGQLQQIQQLPKTIIFNPSDFDFLLTKGNNNTPVDRSSLLLKFDPLLGVPVPINQGQQQQQLLIPTNTNNNPCLSPTLEEEEHNDSNRSFVVETKLTGGLYAAGAAGASAKLLKERSQEVKQQLQLEGEQQQQQEQLQQQQNKRQLLQGGNKKNATMSVDVIKDMNLDNDCNKTFENSNSTQSDDKQINYKMDELEKKIKNEVLKTEDIEKKLKDAEQREEALIKRITEKDKTVSKMNGVIEAYEKAIAELIAEKEQIIQNYEKQLAEVKADRDSNYHHLTSLELTFSDLHVKYEKSKEMTCQLKANEDTLITENRKILENLRLQEQRYDKMKNHAMQQLEIANKKLESITRDHSIESTKLKALLKKEEIARSSMHEQLAQKTKENAELVKICDELISGQGS